MGPQPVGARRDPRPRVEVGRHQPAQARPGEGGGEAEAEDEHEVEHQELKYS